jgi:hypothetical protein
MLPVEAEPNLCALQCHPYIGFFPCLRYPGQYAPGWAPPSVGHVTQHLPGSQWEGARPLAVLVDRCQHCSCMGVHLVGTVMLHNAAISANPICTHIIRVCIPAPAKRHSAYTSAYASPATDRSAVTSTPDAPRSRDHNNSTCLAGFLYAEEVFHAGHEAHADSVQLQPG